MSGSKPFGPGEDFPPRSPIAGKTILTFSPGDPIRFIDLADTIANYTGHAGKFLIVNATENGITVSTATSILDAITALDNTLEGVTTILEADPIKFGADIDMEQFELKQFLLEQLAVDPVSPLDGQPWYNTAENIAKIYMNGAIVPFYSAADALALAGLVSDLGTAQGDIITIQGTIENITDDGILSGSEKPAVVKEYNTLTTEQAGIDAKATQYGVTTEKTNYDNAVTALTAYITGLDPVYTDYDSDTVIVRATFISKFTDVYSTRQILINKIHDNTFTILGTTHDEAEAAILAAESAAADALIAMDELNNISADGWLSKSEKNKMLLDYSILITEQAGIDAKATGHGVTTEKTNYDNAIIALTAYLVALDPAYNNVAEDTVIVRNDFNTAFANVYSTRQTLLNKIEQVAKDAADAAQADATQAISDAGTAQTAADNAQSAADLAQADATSALSGIDDVLSDTILSKGSEKSKIKLEVDDILAEQILLDAKAVIYEITTEKTAYDSAITALTIYLDGLTPDWDNLTVDTVITPNSATFRTKFLDVYNTRNALYLLIYDKASDAAVVAAANAADDAHADRTKVLFDGGFVSAGRFEVGDQVYGDNNAGITGFISATPASDIRFWAGSTALNRGSAPFRVQHDGTLFCTKAVIGGDGVTTGWTVDTEAIYFGTKKITDGYSADGITLAGDGSIHAKNFYINVNGDVAFTALNSNLETVPATSGTYRGTIKIASNEMWENNQDNDTYGGIVINGKGYNGGTSRYRSLMIMDGKGVPLLGLQGNATGGLAMLYTAITQLPYIPTSNAGLSAGQIYRNGAGANVALMIV